MNKSLPQKLSIYTHLAFRYFQKRQALIIRAAICWIIGLIALSNDEINSYDLRFKLRGAKLNSQEVVILNIHRSDFVRDIDLRSNNLLNINEINDITDSFYWDVDIWYRLLNLILSAQPKSVAVTLYFGENIGPVKITPRQLDTFLDSRILWATTTNHLSRIQTPLFSRRSLNNIASTDFRADEDGVVRHFYPTQTEVPHLAELAAGPSKNQIDHPRIINFQGPGKNIPEYSLSSLFNNEIDLQSLKGKIIIIGANGLSGEQYQTPFGSMSKAELIASLTDNFKENRWVTRFHFAWYAIGFLFLTLFATLLIAKYPQGLALFFMIWTLTLIAAISAWAFDTYYIWIPAFSPVILFLVVWFVFLGYHASKIEQMNFQLQQEQRNLQELELIKNNFVSLISHDLKTPIAKIQAVLSRLRTQENMASGLQRDLNSLHSFSEELNRYIQNILKILRVENKDFQLHKEVIDINELIQAAIELLQPLADEVGLQMQSELEPLFSIEVDSTLIKEVLINLIENAIKYSSKGGTVTITSQEIDHKILVQVKDTGQGIAPDEIKNVWGKFVRGKDQDLKTTGSGLGLYLVKYFIELHGGNVQIESVLGQGTIVSFTLPIDDGMR